MGENTRAVASVPAPVLWAFENVYQWTEQLRALVLLDFQPTSEKLEAVLCRDLPMIGVPVGETISRWITSADLVGTVIVVERYLPSGKTPSGEQPPDEVSKERPRIRQRGAERFVAEPPAIDQVSLVADRVLAWWARMWPQLELAKLTGAIGVPELTDAQHHQPERKRGRVGAREKIQAEAERRLRAKEKIPSSRKAFQHELAEWHNTTDPAAPGVAPKTVGDHLRDSDVIRALEPKTWPPRK